jgi:glycosyltransferase involved in cell wall biosynthesis
MSLAIYGIYPPPIGGVSVHIRRLAAVLHRNNIDYIVYDTSKTVSNANSINYYKISNNKTWMIKYLLKCKDRILHYHNKNWLELMILSIAIKFHGGRILVTLHSFRDNLDNSGFIKKISLGFCLKNIDHWITVGINEKNRLIKYGVDENKISVIPAFIFPTTEEEDSRLIPQNVQRFINKHNFNIIANAFHISFFENEDLYGIDMCIELMNRLKSEYGEKNIGLIFCLPEIGDENYYNKMLNLLEQYDIADSFLFMNEKIPLCPILKQSDLFVRPTNTDGDAVSVREALYYKVPVVASDVCDRPEGTILFNPRDQKDFEEKVMDVINNYEYHSNEVKKIEIEDYSENLLNIYKSVL